MGFDDPGCYYEVPGGLTVATQWQLSSPRGLVSCNSPAPGDFRVATGVVKTHARIIRIRGSLTFFRHRTFPYVFQWFSLGFDDPGIPGLLL